MSNKLEFNDKKNSAFGERMREQREKLGLSQEALGVSIGLDESCSRTRISRYESGIHEPNIKTAKMLAKTLQIPLEYLYCEKKSIANIVLSLNKLNDEQMEYVSKEIDKLTQTNTK